MHIFGRFGWKWQSFGYKAVILNEYKRIYKKKYLIKILKISFFGSYTIDIISSCCFGMEVNSINDPGNEFIKQLIIANSLNFGRLKTSLLCIIFNYYSNYVSPRFN